MGPTSSPSKNYPTGPLPHPKSPPWRYLQKHFWNKKHPWLWPNQSSKIKKRTSWPKSYITNLMYHDHFNPSLIKGVFFLKDPWDFFSTPSLPIWKISPRPWAVYSSHTATTSGFCPLWRRPRGPPVAWRSRSEKGKEVSTLHKQHLELLGNRNH